jgi:hypothetical protein
MLRLFVLALILANGVYYAWSDGLLRAYGWGPAQQREPLRVAQQIKPESVRILTPAEFKRVEAQVQADLAPKECLQAGPFDEGQTEVLRRALESGLGSTGWQIEAVTVPARWIIYMGKFSSPEALSKKRGELLALNLAPQVVGNPALTLGLSLGVFETQAAATVELNKLTQRGIRTARVVQEQPEHTASRLHLPAVTETLRVRLNEFKAVLAGNPLTACN